MKNCVSLKEITLPEGVSIIDVATFKNCESLSKVTVSGALTLIREDAFEGCGNVEFCLADGNVKTEIEDNAIYAEYTDSFYTINANGNNTILRQDYRNGSRVLFRQRDDADGKGRHGNHRKGCVEEQFSCGGSGFARVGEVYRRLLRLPAPPSEKSISKTSIISTETLLRGARS